jgi:hypothetical protein
MSAAVPPSLASLRAMVERAEAKWNSVSAPGWFTEDDFLRDGFFPETAAFLAACSPSLLLRLIADAEALEWMEHHANPAHGSFGGGRAEVRDIVTGVNYRGRSLRVCIDAARSPHTGGEG